METSRQRKINALLQKELAEILQGEIRKNGITNLVLTISKVSITTDLSIARVHVSIFPSKNAPELIKAIAENATLIKHDLAGRIKNQIRRTPELKFYLDDSLDYIEKIDKALQGDDNPIKKPDLLDKRKKK